MHWASFADKLFWVIVGLASLVLLGYVVLLQQGMRGGPDLALFDQVIWNSLNGRLFETSQLEARTQLGYHFAPILLALVPLYALGGDAAVLRIVQTVSLIGIAFPVYWFARPRVGRLLSLTLVACLLSAPAIPWINLYDFHETPLAAVPVAFALFFLLRGNRLPFVVCSVLAMLVKEDVGLIVFGFGLYMLVFQRKFRFGVLVAGIGIAYTLIVMRYVTPFFNPSGDVWLGAIYGDMGRNIPEIITTMITRPIFTLQYILTPPKLFFVLHLLIPLALIPLLGIEITWLTAIPLMENLLGSSPLMYDPFTWYLATMFPFVFFGAVVGAQRILTWRSPNAAESLARKMALVGLFATSSLVMYYFFSPLPLAQHPDLANIIPSARLDTGRTLIRSIPIDAVVSTPDDTMAQVSQRRELYVFPSYPDYRQVDYLFADTSRYWYNFHKDAWDEILANGFFETVSTQDGFILAKRRPLEQSLNIPFANSISLVGVTIPSTTTIRGGQILRPILGWRTLSPIQVQYHTHVQLLDSEGHIWAEYDGEPQDGHFPTTMWETDRTVGDQYTFHLPLTMPPGIYRLVAAVYNPGLDIQPIASALVTTIPIEKDKSNITATDLQKQFQLEQPLFVDMSQIRLIGFKPLPSTLVPGSKLPIGVYWRAREKPVGDYWVSAQLLDVSGNVVAEQTDQPAAGAYPTTQWDVGEVLLDWHDLKIPEKLMPGEYTVQIILKNSASGMVLGKTVLGKTSVER